MLRPWQMLLAPASVAALLWWIYPNSGDLQELKARSGFFPAATRAAERQPRLRGVREAARGAALATVPLGIPPRAATREGPRSPILREPAPAPRPTPAPRAEHAARPDPVLAARALIESGNVVEGLRRLRVLDSASGLERVLLEYAAFHAARRQLWEQAGYFYGRLVQVTPGDAPGWEALAWVEEHRGRPSAAIAALKRSLALDSRLDDRHVRLVDWLMRQHLFVEAHAWLGPLNSSSGEQELRQRIALALQLRLPGEERAAWQEQLRRHPANAEALFRLAELLEEQGDVTAADDTFDRALGAAPDDPALLLQVAARRYYAGRIAKAAPLIALLERLPADDAGVLRLLADYYQAFDPARSARALDALHAQTSGDAGTWFLRGELAERLADHELARRAWARSLELNSGRAAGPAAAEMRATCLERLGRRVEAVRAWQDLADRFPDRLAPALALGRLYTGEPNMASYYLDRALRLAPRSVAARRLKAELLLAQGHPNEAAELLSQLRQELPSDSSLLLDEARIRLDNGQAHEASRLVRLGWRQHPSSALRDLNRAARERGQNRTEAVAWDERAGSLERGGSGLKAAWNATDEVELNASALSLVWGATVPVGTELGLGASWARGPWRLDGQFSAFTRAGVTQPLGNMALGWHAGSVGASVRLSQGRWEESAATLAGGVERRAEAEVSWQPESRVSLRALAAARDFTLGAQEGPGDDWLGELTLRPEAASPWSLTYQFERRDWGGLSALAGLPDSTGVHSLLLGFTSRQAVCNFDLQPGYCYDLARAQGAPVLRGGVSWEPTRDVRLGFRGAYSRSTLGLGGPGEYVYAGISGSLWF